MSKSKKAGDKAKRRDLFDEGGPEADECGRDGISIHGDPIDLATVGVADEVDAALASLWS